MMELLPIGIFSDIFCKEATLVSHDIDVTGMTTITPEFEISTQFGYDTHEHQNG